MRVTWRFSLRKRFGYIIFLISIIFVFYLILNSNNPSDLKEIDRKDDDAPVGKVEIVMDDKVDKLVGLVDEKWLSCNIPWIDPFDISIRDMISHPRSTQCHSVQPDFIYLDPNEGKLRLNRSEILNYEKEHNTKVYCDYRYFDRGERDRDIEYTKLEDMTEDLKMEKSFIKVACWKASARPNGTKIYLNAFAYPVPSDSKSHKPLSIDGDDMNVLIFTLDSASTTMIHRHLPKTLKYLADSGYIFFDSFLKVGENTLPNTAALFTGLRYKDEQEDMPAELPEPKKGFYDDWPLIWKRFTKEKGYETIFTEDETHIGMFHFNGNGFKTKPVDHWYIPYWESMMKLGEPADRNSPFCYGSRPTYQILLQILRRHLELGRNRRQFLFSLYGHLTHDFTFDLERSDDSLWQFFTKLDGDNLLNRTIIMIMGDHGPRFSKTRGTIVGFAEERLPFFSIRIPPILSKRYPNLIENLKLNTKRLTTLFDIYVTLLDILTQSYSDSQYKSHQGVIRGQSIFRPLPLERTCFQAGVPDRYCLCEGFTVKSVNDTLAKRAAELVNDQINKKLHGYRKICANWTIDEIKYFMEIPWPKQDNLKMKTYYVAYSAKPLDGIFEGAVSVNLKDDTLTLKTGTLERLNRFGEKGVCQKNRSLWKWCACRNRIN